MIEITDLKVGMKVQLISWEDDDDRPPHYNTHMDHYKGAIVTLRTIGGSITIEEDDRYLIFRGKQRWFFSLEDIECIVHVELQDDVFDLDD